MQVVILAAGEGTRMRPLTERRAKPMLPVAGRPLVDHVARTAVSAGAEEVVVVVGYESDGVREYLGDTINDAPIRYAEQSERQGTADAVAAASDHLDGPFAVLNGDNLYDLGGLVRLFENCPAVACTRADDPSNYGVVETSGDQVQGLLEKPSDPPTDLVNAGAYVFPASARDRLTVPVSDRGERELTDVLDRVVETAPVTPVAIDDWIDVGRPWELLAANERYVARRDRSVLGEVHDDATINGDVVLGPEATVGPGALIEGPALIQAGAEVGHNAYVRGASMIGPDVVVDSGAEVENSVLMSGTTVGRLAYVGDSVVATDCSIGARTTLRNQSGDAGPVTYTVKGERVSTGRQRFGAVIGDGVSTGDNTRVDAGVMLSPGTTTAAGERVSRDR